MGLTETAPTLLIDTMLFDTTAARASASDGLKVHKHCVELHGLKLNNASLILRGQRSQHIYNRKKNAFFVLWASLTCI